MKFSKKVIRFMILGTLFSFLCFVLTGCQAKLEVKERASEIDAGASTSFTLLHVSDTHLTLCDDSDTKEIKAKAKKRTKRFKNLQEQKLEYAMALAKEKDALIVHTGDIMDFPTDANIARAKKFFEDTGCLYVPGNHEPEDRESDYYKKLAEASLRSIDFFAEEINGVVLVGIDNSDHKMTREQLSRLQQVAEEGKPIILLVHAPLYTKDLYDASIVDDGSAYLMAVPEELMKGYPKNKYEEQKADATTVEAYDYIVNQPNIKGILCGHLHIDFETRVGNIPQYVVGLDSVRIVTVR